MTGWNEESTLSVALGNALNKVSYTWGSFSTGSVSPAQLPQATQVNVGRGSAVWIRPSPAAMGIPNIAGRYDGTRVRTIYSMTGQLLDTKTNPEILSIDGAMPDLFATQYAISLGKFYNVDTHMMVDSLDDIDDDDDDDTPTNGDEPQPPGDDDFPPKPDSANPIDWINWLVEVLIWGMKKFSEWLAYGIYLSQKFLWDALPEWVQTGLIDSIKSWFGFWGEVFKFITNPRDYIINMIKGWFAPGSPSIQEQLGTSAATNIIKAIDFSGGTYTVLRDLIETVSKWGQDDIEILEGLIRQPVNIDGVEDVANVFYNKSKEITLNVAGSALLTEWLSLGQVDGTDDFNDKLAELQGYPTIAADLRNLQGKANLGTMWEYFINKKYLNKFPGTGELISIRRLELMTKEEFEDVLAQQAGINADWANKLYQSSLMPPTIDDYITFNLRHPEKAHELKDIMAIVNIDADRYEEIFEERKYVDPSITQARFMFEIGALTVEQVRKLVVRNRFRDEPVGDQEKSDAESMTEYLTGFQTRIWRRQKMLALRSNFVKGYTYEDKLKESAEELLTNPDAVDMYLEASKERRLSYLADRYVKGYYTKEEFTKKIEPIEDIISDMSQLQEDLDAEALKFEQNREKLFTASMLGRFLESGNIDETFLDEEIDLMGLSDKRKGILKAFVKGVPTPPYVEETE